MYLGIDPSLSGTAVACYGSDVVRLSSEPCGPGIKERIARYDDLVNDVWRAIPLSGVSVICIEGYSFGSKHGNEKLAEYGGLLRKMLCELYGDSELIEVPPSSLKRFITGKGNGDKTAVIAAIASRYHVEFKTNDEYDAFGLALMAAAYAGEHECTNQIQRDVIEALKNPKPKKRKGKAA